MRGGGKGSRRRGPAFMPRRGRPWPIGAAPSPAGAPAGGTEAVRGRGMRIRPAEPHDDEAIWGILAPVIRAGETYALPIEMGRADALAYWRSPAHEVFVAEFDGCVVGTY